MAVVNRVTVLGIVALLGSAVASTWTGVAATGSAQAAQDPALGLARLQGDFQLVGRITVAKGVKGERVGQTVRRHWSFAPACLAGACGRIGLVRQRATGIDHVTLHWRAPGFYIGWGSFYVPLQCAGRTYPKGELAAFSITVTVTQALPNSTGKYAATKVGATYKNTSRRNLTRCVQAPARDAATYSGQLVTQSAPARAQAAAVLSSARSPAGS